MDRDTISDWSKASIIYPGPSVSIQNPVEVMRLSRDGVWINPDLKPGEAAQAVLNSIDAQIKVLVERAVQAEREECAKVCEAEGQRIDASWSSCAAAIRSRT